MGWGWGCEVGVGISGWVVVGGVDEVEVRMRGVDEGV